MPTNRRVAQQARGSKRLSTHKPKTLHRAATAAPRLSATGPWQFIDTDFEDEPTKGLPTVKVFELLHELFDVLSAQVLAPRARASLLLALATHAAAEAKDGSLARILWALHLATNRNDLSWIEGKASALTAAESFLEAQEQCFAATFMTKRVQFIRELAGQPAMRDCVINDPEMSEVAERALFWCRAARADLLIGDPKGTWVEIRARMTSQLNAVACREPMNRELTDFVRAVLRGWGMSAGAAKDATKRALQMIDA